MLIRRRARWKWNKVPQIRCSLREQDAVFSQVNLYNKYISINIQRQCHRQPYIPSHPRIANNKSRTYYYTFYIHVCGLSRAFSGGRLRCLVLRQGVWLFISYSWGPYRLYDRSELCWRHRQLTDIAREKWVTDAWVIMFFLIINIFF